MKKDKEIIKTDGILYKISRFFKNLFGKNKTNIETIEEVSIEGNTEEAKVETFEEYISIKKDEDYERLLELQQKFKEGKLHPEDVTEEEIDKLTSLYNEQIEELNKKIEEDRLIIESCNKKIMEYKMKNAESNQTA